MQSLTRALVAFALATTGCAYDWTVGNGQSDASVDAAPAADGARKLDCRSAACSDVCATGQSCEMSCDKSSCDLTCQAGSSCELACTGSSCDLTCEAGSTCKLSCPITSSCTLTCEAGATCACTGAGCK